MSNHEDSRSKQGFSGIQVTFLVLGAILFTAGASYWLYSTYLNPDEFRPVALSTEEQTVLDSKLRQLGVEPGVLLPYAHRDKKANSDARLTPEKYVEPEGSRDIRLSERELNAIVASNPDMASRVAVDLSRNLASARMLIPVEPGMPVMGGRTLRVDAGLELTYTNERPVVKLRGISIMGVPVPNAWLGNLKNVDLVKEFGNDPGFWQGFADGIEKIEVAEGQLHIRLRE